MKPEIDTLITGVVVTHNTLDLFKRCYEAFRKFHPGMRLIIIDGSTDNDPCRNYVISLSNDKTRVVLLDRNIGHGRGLDKGISFVVTDFALIFDSDTEIIKSPVVDMMSLVSADTYGVGHLIDKDFSGYDYGARPEESKKGKMVYLDPYFALIKIGNYKKYSPFIHHGAPGVKAMLELHRKNLAAKSLKDFPHLDEWIKHEVSGTRKERIMNELIDIPGTWDKIDDDAPALPSMKSYIAIAQGWVPGRGIIEKGTHFNYAGNPGRWMIPAEKDTDVVAKVIDNIPVVTEEEKAEATKQGIIAPPGQTVKYGPAVNRIPEGAQASQPLVKAQPDNSHKTGFGRKRR